MTAVMAFDGSTGKNGLMPAEATPVGCNFILGAAQDVSL